MTRYDHTSARTGDGTDIWCTPRAFVELVERRLGVEFVLDAAANEETAIRPAYLGPGSPHAEDAVALSGIQWAYGVVADLDPVCLVDPVPDVAASV